jgi:PAS domain S-box-containing protein
LNSDDLPEVWANVEAALDPVNPKPYSATYRINMPDGSQKWIEAHGIATFEGEGHNRCATSLAGTVQDITERKRAEEALRQSLERLEKVMEIETVGVMFWDLNTGCMMDANDTFLKLMGYSRSQVEARELNWQNLTPPEYMDVSRAEVEKFLATGRVGPYEKEYFRKDGTRRWLLFAGSSLGNNQCVEFCVDIADRKKAEQQLVDLNQQLEDRVRRRTAELEAANKELEAFSYSVSHDLRSPLRAISGFSQAVMEDYGSRLPAEGQEYLGTICRGAMRMGELIDDLLAFSRLSRQSISLSPVNTCNLVSQCLEDLKSTYMDRVIEFSVDELPPCLGDRALLKQVWTNLLSNAIKFTSNRPLASVQVGVQFEPGKVVYFIKDNGAGFDMKYANKLFGVFQRLHRNDEFEGTGVGLAIVQRIVHRHGGRVWADAVLDQGATFYFTVAEEGKCIYE